MKSKRGNISPYRHAGEETGRLAEIIGMVDQYTVPSITTAGQAWNRLEKQLCSADYQENQKIMMAGSAVHKEVFRVTGENAPLPFRTIYTRIAAAAALLCLLFTGYLMLYQFSTTGTGTGYGERLFVQLPDGSGVTLNAGSKIEYKTFGWKRDREVSLEGEAFFEVRNGSRFTVVTGNVRTRVLGTSFNVFARDREFRVKCYAGRIEVITKSGQHAILEPGYYLTGTQDRITGLSTESDNRADSWIRGEFYFHNEPLVNVLSEIERQFNITIKYTATERRSYSGYFNDRNLDTALNLVCIPMQLSYKYLNDRQIEIF